MQNFQNNHLAVGEEQICFLQALKKKKKEISLERLWQIFVWPSYTRQLEIKERTTLHLKIFTNK